MAHNLTSVAPGIAPAMMSLGLAMTPLAQNRGYHVVAFAVIPCDCDPAPKLS